MRSQYVFLALPELNQVKILIEDVASQYNLHLNEKKTEITHRPFTSNLSVARQRVASVLRTLFKTAREGLRRDSPAPQFSSKMADHTIAEIRRIARENNVDYATLASPALAILVRGTHRIRDRVGDTVEPPTAQLLERINVTVIKLATFLFLMDIRSSTAHKLAKIFLECSLLNNEIGAGRVAFEGLILDTVRLALEQARLTKINGPEIINVLVAADAVCRATKGITEDLLRSALGVEGNWKQHVGKLKYFELVSVLYFARRKRTFDDARQAVCEEIKTRVKSLGSRLKSHTEETLMFFDFLSCPHIDRTERSSFYDHVARAHGSNSAEATHFQQFSRVSKAIFFVAWEGADHFQAMLERRELQPAYDS